MFMMVSSLSAGDERLGAAAVVVADTGVAVGGDRGDDRVDTADRVGAAGGGIFVGGFEEGLDRKVGYFADVHALAVAELHDGAGVEAPEPVDAWSALRSGRP